MKYNFSWSSVSGGAPYVTFSSLGIAFNSVSIEKLGSPEKIMVGFDEEKLVIGVRAYDGNINIKPYEFSDRIRNGWIRIGCKEFIRYLQKLTGIDYSIAKRYIAEYDGNTNTLIVELVKAYEDEEGEE
jgi:hypothetical protein